MSLGRISLTAGALLGLALAVAAGTASAQEPNGGLFQLAENGFVVNVSGSQAAGWTLGLRLPVQSAGGVCSSPLTPA